MLLREWLEAEPFTLVMSSGFFGFFAHCGVLQALEDAKLTPAQAAGSSAGALVTGAWAAGLSAEALRDELFSLQRKDFWDPGWGLGLLRGRLFEERLQQLLPVQQFSECRVPLLVSVYELKGRATEVLTEGELSSAIRASCAFPGMFQPVRREGKRYLDGGIADRSGIEGIHHHERIFFHHLASRSPWRRKNSKALRIPSRPQLTALVLHDLPRVGPFRLQQGRHAYHAAYRGAQQALLMPIERLPQSPYGGHQVETSVLEMPALPQKST